MSEALSNLKDHAPTLPSAGDVRDAVQSHLPSVDMDTMRAKAPGKRSLVAIVIGLLAAAGALVAIRRRSS